VSRRESVDRAVATLESGSHGVGAVVVSERGDVARLLLADPVVGVLVVLSETNGRALVDAAERAGAGGRVLLASEKSTHEIRQGVRALVDAAQQGAALADLARQIEDHKREQHRLAHAAKHDALTGLANRSNILEQIDACMQRRTESSTHAVLFLDCDNFKLINDGLGHEAGDELLVKLARRLVEAAEEVARIIDAQSHLVGRLGGDEFLILLDGIRSSREAAIAGDLIQQLLSKPVQVSGRWITVSASIGIAVASERHQESAQLVRDADAAMYEAKEMGKSRCALFDEKLHRATMERLRLESDLLRALEREEFALVFEPIVHLFTGSVAALEVLLRWPRPDGTVAPPLAFLSAAEESGLINPIGRWGLRTACEYLSRWRVMHPSAAGVQMNVNLSVTQLRDPELPSAVGRILEETGVPPAAVTFEFKESAAQAESSVVIPALHRLRAVGVGLCMDGFGTGLSSLGHLHQIPVDTVKIDRSFIASMTMGREYVAIIHGILSLAQSLNIGVIAEGVEREDQVAQLLDLSCDFVQGYHITRPMSPAQAESMLQHPVWSGTGRAGSGHFPHSKT
jgi:diguanylate cyclase (GGDEF)-like protein